jgi:hypothetical protein
MSYITRCLPFALLLLGASTSVASVDTWVPPGTSGFWINRAPLVSPPPFIPGTNTWWANLVPPATADSATFSGSGAYTVQIDGATSAIQGLSITAGSPTFVSLGGARTLSVNSNSAGFNSVNISGTGTTLNLGNGTSGTGVIINADYLTMSQGAALNLRNSSKFTTNTTFNGQLQGIVTVDGSTLELDNTFIPFGSTLAGNPASITLQNFAVARFTGTLAAAGANVNGGTAIINVAGGSLLSIEGGSTGGLTMASDNISGANATLNVNGSSSQVNVFAPATIGTVNNLGTASINVGTTASGATLATGLQLFTINRTGTVTIGSGANSGSLVVDGNITIDGGTLQKNSGAILITSGNIFTIEGGGRAVFDSFVPDSFGPVYPAVNEVYNVTGNGSKFEVANSFVVEGDAQYNIQNNAQLLVDSGGTTLKSGVININGGAVDLKTLTYSGGAVNLNVGSLSFLGNVTVGIGGLLGIDLNLTSGRALSLSGTTTIDPGRTLTVSGGALTTGQITNNGTFSFQSGSVTVTGAGGLAIGSGNPLGKAVSLGAGSNLNVTNTTTINSGALLDVENGSNFATATLNNNGEFDVNGLAATANMVSVNNNGLIRGEGTLVAAGASNAIANLAGGEIRAEAGKRIKLIGANATNLGKINLQDGTAEFTQPLTNGSTGQIVGRGTVIIGGTGLTNNGNIAFSSGITDVFGDVNNATGTATKGITVSGNADVTFWDDITNGAGSLFKVSSGSSVTVFGTYSGAGISGSANDIHLEADISPGFSPASVDFGGNLEFSSTTRLKIELGGTSPGTQYDQVHVSEQLSLDGLLNVVLINSFVPALGNSFDILDWNTLAGTFSALSLPALGAGLGWDASQLYTSGVLRVVSAGLPGDYNGDGHVDAADYTVWRDHLGQNLALPNDATPGTVTQADFNVWKSNFGNHLGSGSGSSGAVPEPATLVMILAGTLTISCCRRPRVS